VVEGGLAARILREGFGEEQFDGGGELAYGCQRDDKEFGQGLDEGILNAGTELDAGADQLGAGVSICAEVMAAGTWIKEHAGLGDGEGRGPGALYVEDSAAQEVEMSGGFSGMVPGDAAESPGVEDASREREVREKRREAVHFDTHS